MKTLFFLMEDPVGFEPTIRELQSHALPLGYGPKKMLHIHFNIKYISCQ